MQARDPALVWDFYHYRRSVARSATPNAAHHALAKLSPTLITQNVDGLSATVGHTRLLEMHGTIRTARCARCGTTTETFPSEGIPPCPRSGCAGVLRPNVVWFGEMPQHLDEIDRLLKAADVFLVVGTSSTVRRARSPAEGESLE
jgi:NAD-dependent deacetylase